MKQNIEQDKGRIMWYVIIKATDDPKLGDMPCVQKMVN